MVYQRDWNFTDFQARPSGSNPQLKRKSVALFGQVKRRNSACPVRLEAAEGVCEFQAQCVIEELGYSSVYGRSIGGRLGRVRPCGGKVPRAAYDISITLFYFQIKVRYVRRLVLMVTIDSYDPIEFVTASEVESINETPSVSRVGFM